MKQAYLLLTVIMLVLSSACVNQTPKTITATSLVHPGYINKDSANRMIKSFLTAENGVENGLKSLLMDANLVRDYLADTSIKEIKLMFAHTPSYIDSAGSGKPVGFISGALTIIMAGVNSSGDYVFTPTELVPNRCLPCPFYCPKGNASAHLLE